MTGIRISVDNQLCDVLDPSEARGDWRSVTAGSPVPIYVRCNTSPTTGRIVTLVKNGTFTDNLDYYMNICEVEVWGKYI